LQSIVSENGIVKFSDSFSDGTGLYEQAQKLELEGIVPKKADSIYEPGKRRKDWLKIPTAKRQEFVIGGWADSTRARSFRSLLFGAYCKQGEFEWIGRSGGGFKESEMRVS
jgi:bifunctional non-homologous end joining protein LigD